jgi:protein involved in polysaccharide export with SLBB domain
MNIKTTQLKTLFICLAVFQAGNAFSMNVSLTEKQKLYLQKNNSITNINEETKEENNNLEIEKLKNFTVENKNFINESKVFGEWLFNGSFAQTNIQGFNENYKISIGDKIIVKLWGVIQQDLKLTVDKQGNIFFPEIGPIKVVGITNSQINSVVGGYIRKVYKSNVNYYVNLDNEQPVKVYVSGFAKKPGLYAGLSSDSILYYIDKAGGIDPARGSFLAIVVLRDGIIKEKINLYEFLLKGKINSIQFKDGDIVQVLPRKNKTYVLGNVRNSFEFEFENNINLSQIISYAQPESTVNKVQITRKNNNDIKTYSYDINLNDEKNNSSLEKIIIQNDDKIYFNTDKKINTVSIQIDGEHDSVKELVMPLGSTIQDVINQLKINQRTDLTSIQLFRESIKAKQKENILESVRMLENNILSTSSTTKNLAELRDKEANMIMKLIDSAKKVEPKGQVILENSESFSQIYLEEGDLIKIPSKNWLVNISGQVLQPTSLVWNKDYNLKNYIEHAGGYLNNAELNKVLIRKTSGAIQVYNATLLNSIENTKVNKGDEIVILPKVDLKNTQITKDIAELIYQIAVGAAVILKL